MRWEDKKTENFITCHSVKFIEKKKKIILAELKKVSKSQIRLRNITNLWSALIWLTNYWNLMTIVERVRPGLKK